MVSLIEFCQSKSEGVHMTGHAAAHDVFFTMIKIDELVSISKVHKWKI